MLIFYPVWDFSRFFPFVEFQVASSLVSWSYNVCDAWQAGMHCLGSKKQGIFLKLLKNMHQYVFNLPLLAALLLEIVARVPAFLLFMVLCLNLSFIRFFHVLFCCVESTFSLISWFYKVFNVCQSEMYSLGSMKRGISIKTSQKYLLKWLKFTSNNSLPSSGL